VPGEERAVVEEGERALVLEDDVRGLLARDDLTEAAIRVLGGQVRDTVKQGRGALTHPITLRRSVRPGRVHALAAAVALLATLIMLGPGAADAGVAVKTGKYSGKTDQDAISTGFRRIQFTVKKGKVTLTTEPTVAREACVSAPVFTLGGTTAKKKLGGNGTFTFTHTFLGTKIDKIHGRFVAPNEVQGFAVYNFAAQDLCSAGKSRVNFTAKHK
jgi:hypothetical protein